MRLVAATVCGVERHDITLLDGGMGQELLRMAEGEPTPLWSAQVMKDQPDLVRTLHREFIDAGADVITVNSYSATRCRLGPAGREADYERLQHLACELAVEARGDRADVRIAGCLSPYGWSYHPDITLPFDELTARFAETAAIQAPYVELIICETMGSIHEATAALHGAAATGKPVWVSWSLLDDDTARLRSGEPLSDAIPAISSAAPAAILVNCSTPEAFTAAMPILAESPVPFGAYANGFTHVAAEFGPGTTTTMLGHRHDLDPAVYSEFALAWVEQGASIIGGCCEIGPAHIAELARHLDR
jgi:S-methylmethionine-dependent homocysteine/selenocysteine methylase